MKNNHPVFIHHVRFTIIIVKQNKAKRYPTEFKYIFSQKLFVYSNRIFKTDKYVILIENNCTFMILLLQTQTYTETKQYYLHILSKFQ